MTSTDLKQWPDEDLCRELAAQRCGSNNAKLPPERWAETWNEYERRLDEPQISEDCEFDRLYRQLQS